MFKVTSSQTVSNLVGDAREVEVPKKKLKTDTENTENRPQILQDKQALSPEQKNRIKGNLLAAKVKRQCKQTPLLDCSIGVSWFEAIEKEFSKDYFIKLSKFVEAERSKYIIFPKEEDVWSWTKLCAIDEIKVVILGQDPYHNPKEAHGLCFSVPKGITKPPSLRNIFKELSTDIEGFQTPDHGSLVGWAKQGVLLLNACLTVRQNSPNSHKDNGWEQLTDAVIKCLNSNNRGLVFLLWGSYAQKKADFVDKKKHFVLTAPHPSPLSASRGFFGCKHFSKCNKILLDEGKAPIDWNELP